MSTPHIPQSATSRRRTKTRLSILVVVVVVATVSVGLAIHSYRIDITRAEWLAATKDLRAQAKHDEVARADYESEKRTATSAAASTKQLVAASAGTLDLAGRTTLDAAANQLTAASNANPAPALLAAPEEPDRTIAGFATATAVAKDTNAVNATRVLATVSATDAMVRAESVIHATTTKLARGIPANLVALKKTNPHADPIALRDAETTASAINAEAGLVRQIETLGAYVDAATAVRNSQKSATDRQAAAVSAVEGGLLSDRETIHGPAKPPRSPLLTPSTDSRPQNAQQHALCAPGLQAGKSFADTGLNFHAMPTLVVTGAAPPTSHRWVDSGTANR